MIRKVSLRNLHAAKHAIREVYAWPGGYPLYAVMGDCEPMSISACRENWREIVSAHLGNNLDSDWYVQAIDINYEDPSLYCAHTGNRIESAYAEDDAIENGGTGELTVD